MTRSSTIEANALFVLPLLLAPAPPGTGVELGFGWALVKMLVALLVVCVGAYLLLRYGLRRLVAPRLGGRNMRVIERCPLSATRALWIVEVGRRCFLLGEAESSISLLAELPADELATAALPPQSSFLQLLRRGTADAAPGHAPPAAGKSGEPGAAREARGGDDEPER